MCRWMTRILLGVLILAPSGALAQSPLSLASVQVQLWPEYDQPSMLVIYDFQVGPGSQLPVGVTIDFPADANLVAVAVQASDGSLLNAEYAESTGSADAQTIVVQAQSASVYRVEYYQPLVRSGDVREFSFRWPGKYPVDDFGIRLRLPSDASALKVNPPFQPVQDSGAFNLQEKKFGPLQAGQQVSVSLSYSRQSDALAASQQDLQPTQPLDGSTAGRVMLKNYVPYVLAALGLVLIAGGALYYWRSSRSRGPREKHHRPGVAAAQQPGEDEYCHQCGTRAQPGDRFCRVCGSRLRQPS